MRKLVIALTAAWIMIEHGPSTLIQGERCQRLAERLTYCESGSALVGAACGANDIVVVRWNEGGAMQSSLYELGGGCDYFFPLMEVSKDERNSE